MHHNSCSGPEISYRPSYKPVYTCNEAPLNKDNDMFLSASYFNKKYPNSWETERANKIDSDIKFSELNNPYKSMQSILDKPKPWEKPMPWDHVTDYPRTTESPNSLVGMFNKPKPIDNNYFDNIPKPEPIVPMSLSMFDKPKKVQSLHNYLSQFAEPKPEPVDIFSSIRNMQNELNSKYSSKHFLDNIPKPEPIVPISLPQSTLDHFSYLDKLDKIKKKDFHHLDYTNSGVLSNEPVGKQFGLPGPWQPPSEFGIGGPGEARAVFPGLVQRERVDFSGHNNLPDHINTEHFSVLNGINKPIKTEDHVRGFWGERIQGFW